jgi:hypothetical protein
MEKGLMKKGFLLALAEATYIFLVALLMNGVGRFFSNTPDNKILAPMIFLLLFVLSAAISGALVLGQPILMYLEGKKKEAVKLFGLTLGWLAIILAATLSLLAVLK